jgi:hypothetical protein
MIIRKLRTCFRLSGRERRLAMSAIALVALVRLGLWLLPFQRAQRCCEYLGRPKRRRVEIELREIVWAVRLGSRYVPGATCLTQALSTQILLGRNRRAGQVHIGVARDAKLGFRAHAWVESQGKVLIGKTEELGVYAPMLVLNGPSGPHEEPRHI